MSEFGEKVDRILELLNKEKTLTVEELKKTISFEDTSLLYFLQNGELIELKNGNARITDFGAMIISAELTL
jgi:predicted transcriptional regulator